MQALFVHGLGRTPLSGWPLLWQLNRGGLTTCTFAYVAAWTSFLSIKNRLLARICALAAQGDYVLIGHSLGGVLLRAALSDLPSGVRPPRHVFLLASPIQAARLAKRLAGQAVFRVVAGDCGQLLGSDTRMAAIGATTTPTTAIIGTQGFSGALSPFAGEVNDGVVSVSEVTAPWLTDLLYVPSVHTLLPAHRQTGDAILAKVKH